MKSPIWSTRLPLSNYFEEIQERVPICIVQSRITVYNTKFQNNNHILYGRYYMVSLRIHNILPTSKKFEKDQDRRRSYFVLHKNLLGAEAIQNRINNAKNWLQNLSWGSKVKKGLKLWQIYLCPQRSTHYPSGVDEGSKIRHFIQGISNTSLTPVMASLSSCWTNAPKAWRKITQRTITQCYCTLYTLKLQSVTSTIDITTPIHHDYQSLPKIDLTYQDLEWDPQNSEFATQESLHRINIAATRITDF